MHEHLSPTRHRGISANIKLSLPQPLLEKQLCITNPHLLRRSVRVHQFCSGLQLLSRENSSHRTLNPTRFQIYILQGVLALRAHLDQFPGNFFIQHFRKHLERYNPSQNSAQHISPSGHNQLSVPARLPWGQPRCAPVHGHRNTRSCDVWRKTFIW